MFDAWSCFNGRSLRVTTNGYCSCLVARLSGISAGAGLWEPRVTALLGEGWYPQIFGVYHHVPDGHGNLGGCIPHFQTQMVGNLSVSAGGAWQRPGGSSKLTGLWTKTTKTKRPGAHRRTEATEQSGVCCIIHIYIHNYIYIYAIYILYLYVCIYICMYIYIQ